MLTTPQADLVAHLDRLRTEQVEVTGELAPVVVGPYAGQLLRLGDLVHAVPALWVDVEASSLEPDDESGDLITTGITAEVILCTVNQASLGAGFADGLAAVSWALRALTSGPIRIAGQRLRPVGPVRFRRIASDESYWAGRISLDLELDQ